MRTDQCERLERDARQARRERERAGKQPGHPEIDRPVLALIRIAVARIDENPALLQADLHNIEQWVTRNAGRIPRAYAERQALIRRHPWPELCRMLLEESDEGQRLRSSHPFTGLVMPEERARVLAA